MSFINLMIMATIHIALQPTKGHTILLRRCRQAMKMLNSTNLIGAFRRLVPAKLFKFIDDAHFNSGRNFIFPLSMRICRIAPRIDFEGRSDVAPCKRVSQLTDHVLHY